MGAQRKRRSSTTEAGCVAIAAPVTCGAEIASAIDPEVVLHLRHNLRIREFVSGSDTNNALRKRLGSAETFLEFQLCLTRPD